VWLVELEVGIHWVCGVRCGVLKVDVQDVGRRGILGMMSIVSCVLGTSCKQKLVQMVPRIDRGRAASFLNCGTMSAIKNIVREHG
jgi:hypothetical protein